MAAILAEQMRHLANRIDELAQNEELPQGALEGSLNARQLAELLGIDDLNTFTRSINKIKRGDADKLTRVEMTEMAIAFVNLLAAQPEDTTKAMTAIRRVSSKEEPVMESQEAAMLQKSYMALLGYYVKNNKKAADALQDYKEERGSDFELMDLNQFLTKNTLKAIEPKLDPQTVQVLKGIIIKEDSKYPPGKKPIEDYTPDEMENVLKAAFDDFLHHFPRGKQESFDDYVARLDFDKMEQMLKRKKN